LEVNIIKKLQEVERLSEVNLESTKLLIPYKRFDQVWIKADKPVMEIYATTLKNSELQFYVSKNLKAWVRFGLSILKSKNNKQILMKLLGVRVVWRFLEKVDFSLYADIIYYRQRAVVMVYNKEKKVVKFALTQRGKKDLRNEVISQRLASTIPSKQVFIPKIIKEFRNEDVEFTVEEYFEGKRQTFKNKSVLEANYHKVFQFLLKFYLSAPMELQALSGSKFLNHEFVEEFIRKQTHGAEVVSIFRKLYAKEKRMILCRIHGDLSHNNILIGNDKVCIIDWGKSKQHYLARDLDNSSFDTEDTYNNFVKQAKIDDSEVYSYREQIFLARFIEMSRLIHNGIKRNTLTPYLYSLTKSENMRLLKMGQKL